MVRILCVPRYKRKQNPKRHQVAPLKRSADRGRSSMRALCHRSPVERRYYSGSCSLSFLVTLLLSALVVALPLLLAHGSRGAVVPSKGTCDRVADSSTYSFVLKIQTSHCRSTRTASSRSSPSRTSACAFWRASALTRQAREWLRSRSCTRRCHHGSTAFSRPIHAPRTSRCSLPSCHCSCGLDGPWTDECCNALAIG